MPQKRLKYSYDRAGGTSLMDGNANIDDPNLLQISTGNEISPFEDFGEGGGEGRRHWSM